MDNNQKSIFAKKSDSKVNDPNIPQWRILDWFKDLKPDQVSKFKALFDELQKFNSKLNLVSPKSLITADLMHFCDSIKACEIIFKSTPIDEIYDFGSGNGFPGLVFGILYPTCKVKLVEIDQRKSEYLKHCISVLGLSNCTVLNTVIEKLPPNSVRFAMSRGYANITKALMSSRKIVPKGGKYYHLKSEEWAGEVASIPIQLCSFWTPSLVGEYKLPIGEVKFAVVKTEKIAD